MKLIIFDCDGTLVDSQNMIVEAMNITFERNGISLLPRKEVLSIVGLSLPLAIETLLPGKKQSVIADVAEAYRAAFGILRRDPANHEPLYDGVRDVIETLSARDDVLLGIATGKSVRGVDALLERMGLHEHFVTVQTADTHPSKPNPSMIDTAVRETAVDACDTIMIGDTTFDIRMARNAGVGALGVAWGYHPVRALVAEGADDVASHAHELLALVDRLLQRRAGR
ncbi:MAG: HAD-IA family hydrolase [Alphaproteobacteria bacterium]|nr:HAD-IA family hydrolase [Alphaproteobacteria bacterium]